MKTLQISKNDKGYRGFVHVPCSQIETVLQSGENVVIQAPDEKPFWGKMVTVDRVHNEYIVQLMGVNQIPSYRCEDD